MYEFRQKLTGSGGILCCILAKIISSFIRITETKILRQCATTSRFMYQKVTVLNKSHLKQKEIVFVTFHFRISLVSFVA